MAKRDASKADASTALRRGGNGAHVGRPAPRSLAASVGLVLFASQWPLILGLIFGGCCSNAWFLELGTAAVPTAGTLITFAQFLATALTCIPSQLEWTYEPDGAKGAPPRRSRLPRLKKPKVPISRWSVQVLLYLTTSLLNNAAFAYDIPMSVHIVFRSGGLVINMILGWAVEGRRYNPMQILSVLVVTVGVVAATFFAQSPPAAPVAPTSGGSPSLLEQFQATISPTYIFGVSLLLLALILSGLMGLWQERTFRTYGRNNWQEALFYAHTLSLPIFLARWRRLREEMRLADATPPIWLGWIPHAAATLSSQAALKGSGGHDAGVLHLGPGCDLTQLGRTGVYYSSGSSLSSCASNANYALLTGGGDSIATRAAEASSAGGAWRLAWSGLGLSPLARGPGPHASPRFVSLAIPSFWPVLLLNVLTQLLCINGVNRLTSQVTSLTVTLVLVLRKATSLAISVVFVGGRTGNWGLWSGAGAVLLGTVGYTLASSKPSKPSKTEPAAARKEAEAQPTADTTDASASKAAIFSAVQDPLAGSSDYPVSNRRRSKRTVQAGSS